MLAMKNDFAPELNRCGVEVVCADVVQTLDEDELCKILPDFDGWVIGDDPASRRVLSAGCNGRLRAAVKWGYGYTMGCAARSNVCFLHSTNMPGEFARDCSISIFQGFTVTYVAMQLAFHMGFHKLTVIGCDHNFSATGPANTTVKADGKDRNHFDPNYFSDGVSWQLPDLFQSEVAYQIAHQNYMDNGRQLYNSTAGGKLEVLPRIDLAEFIQLA